MIDGAVLEAIKSIVPEEKILLREPLGKHTSFRIGGPADCLVELESKRQLKMVLGVLKQTPFFVLGNGSNLLASDSGYRGVVLHIGTGMNRIRVSGDRITVQAGALLSQVAKAALGHGLTGLEFAAGIPGSVGGAMVMNAGAYGGEMKQVVETVTMLTKKGEDLTLSNEAMEFGYRTSIVKTGSYIVTEATLRLRAGDPARIKAKMDDLASRRREKQPLEYPSAGSTFKRPEGHFAGQLIEEAGLRGFQVGGARVSDKHCGFVVNAGGATASDVRDLMWEIQRRVKEKSGVELEPEVVLLGQF